MLPTKSRQKSALVAFSIMACFASPAASETRPAIGSTWSSMTTGELITAAPADAWQQIEQSQLLYLEFDPPAGSGTGPARVIIQLAPDFAPNHVAALKELVAKDFFNGKSIVRSQDNYVVQWGDGPAATQAGFRGGQMTAEFDRPIGRDFKPFELKDGDVYAPKVGFWRNWPVAWDPAQKRYWLPHCYAMVGAGRDEGADSGGPAELYAVNGHSPRGLDRNVTLLGRVVLGMEHFATLPRGGEAMGFYGETQSKPRIIRAVLGSQLPEREQINLQALRTDHAIYPQVLESRRNRRDSWTKFKAGRLELCNAPLPVRIAPKE
ncbi:hypothetical protein PbB2_00848 [Candidatus Phycosocius bacilliformis]|uniref:PPIase cyclophilin-type domain-containing protein n=1 Tax=Candidatus Phycosocius bacilliformis TaxID=1445552 RepID=A0A2P2E817_9PROT|nr:peptidylprolyl isomerase [Candidatus Phycosocius bacilliformis]GBF57187.1 hypothetical protein PbB2_00848 [Candidatus Phycosocius bacilliformis]